MARKQGFTPSEISFLSVCKSANGQKTADELAAIINAASGATGDAAIDGQYVRTKYAGIVSNWCKNDSANAGRAFPVPGPKGAGRGKTGRTSTRMDFDSAFAQLGVVVEESEDDHCGVTTGAFQGVEEEDSPEQLRPGQVFSVAAWSWWVGLRVGCRCGYARCLSSGRVGVVLGPALWLRRVHFVPLARRCGQTRVPT